jgi:hypothetical protein
MLTLEFLQISQPVGKESFMQHITELIHVKLEKGDTYNAVFSKLRERMKNESEDKKQAAEDWISFNLEGQKDNLSVFDTVISEEDEEFAVFNLKKSNR